MRSILKTFIKYPVLGNVLLTALMIFGFFGLRNMKTTFFPQIPTKIITIQAIYPGAAPREIEEGIILKIEDNLKGITGVERITSTSVENSGTITVELQTGYDADVALADVKNAVDMISYFPVGMEPPVIFKREAMEFAINFAIHGDVSLLTLKKHARKMERDLRSAEGISKITVSGFPAEEIEIGFREDDLRRFGLSMTEVSAAIGKANIRVTGGRVKGPKEELLIRADEKSYYAEELANLVVKSTSDGAIVRLKDVANLRDRWEENPNRFYYDGKPSVEINVSSTNEEDLFQTADYVNAYIEEFNKTHTDVQASVLRDGSKVIRERIDILTSNGLYGIILVVLFLTFFLNARLSFWVALGIPISFAGMFLVAGFYGLTINVMSLLAMILVVGMLVDDAIVISENIYQHYERGKKPMAAAIEGTLEVLPSVVSAVLTTIVIFITFYFLEGGLGDRAGDLSFVVIWALVFSLVEGIFILPAHIAHSKALKIEPGKKNKFDARNEKALMWVRDKIYAPILRFNLQHTVIALAIPVALFFISIGLLQGGFVKTTFFPNIEQDNTSVSLEMPPGTAVSITDSILQTIEAKVWEVNETYKKDRGIDSDLVLAVSRKLGPSTHVGSVTATFIPGEERDLSSLQITNLIRKRVGRIPGAQELAFGGRSHWGKPISVAIMGDDLDHVRNAKDLLKAELNKISVLKDVTDNDPPGLREVNIRLKDKAYALGLTTRDVMSQVRSGFFGGEAQRIQRGIDEVRIWVRFTEAERATLDKLARMRIRLPNNREYPLQDIAEWDIRRGIMSINHLDTRRMIKVEADIANPNESVTDLVSEIQKNVLPDISAKYPDLHFDFEGQSRESAKTARSASKVIPPILLLMFFIVVVNFRSFNQAIAVYTLIPFGIIGVIWGHLIQGYIISVLSIFGMIALIGIMVNDSLVLVNAMNLNLKRGMKFKEALFDAGVSRFRPVLLTSLTTIAGLAPLMFETSFQAQFLSPMAISVAYGLLFATMLTLLMLPAVLVIINKIKQLFFRHILRKDVTPESIEPAIREELFIKAYGNANQE